MSAAIGAVRLDVAELEASREFYETAIGLEVLKRSDELVRLGAGDQVLVELAGRPQGSPRPPGTTGLFHLAILVPDRLELARALRRALESGGRLSGASDHLVSEALYLSDPEGNGIEIYRDRPREEWGRVGGEIEMATLPLDLEDLVGELSGGESPSPAMPPETRIGHVHLQVSDLSRTEAFYAGALGLDVTVRSYPGALFFSAGGYHHHVGANTWGGTKAPPPPPGSLGLRWFELVLASAEELEGLAARLPSAGVETEPALGGLQMRDPSGNGVLLRAAPNPA